MQKFESFFKMALYFGGSYARQSYYSPRFDEGSVFATCTQKLCNLIVSIKEAIARFFQWIFPCLAKKTKENTAPNLSTLMAAARQGDCDAFCKSNVKKILAKATPEECGRLLVLLLLKAQKENPKLLLATTEILQQIASIPMFMPPIMCRGKSPLP